MTRETDMRRFVCSALKSLDANAVENALVRGYPDVEFVGGTMELKHLPKWPVRPETIVRVDHFTPIQRGWLRRRAARGGRTWLLLRVDREWLLFKGEVAADVVGCSNAADLRAAATALWATRPTESELVELVRHR
jgi:hypothetical protein